MQKLQFWTPTNIYKKIKIIEPQLESWNAKSDPGQIKLQNYLDDIQRNLGTLPQAPDLFLHMDIDVQKQDYLLHHHDLDNYLYPVVNRLGTACFKFVSARKRVGGGSWLLIGQTKTLVEIAEKETWRYFSYDAGNGSGQKPFSKNQLREALKAEQNQQLEPGGVEVQLIWRCSSHRNWASLWKPTIDAMGPVLGEPFAHRPFYPNDDRIVSLGLHLNIDDMIGWSVYVGMMWRLSPISL